jgi:DNA (cytosine-5)-methyltransferase 1
LLTGREGARLMGLPEDYVLPRGSTAALKVLGDGVAVPVVRALAEQILKPLLTGRSRAAA